MSNPPSRLIRASHALLLAILALAVGAMFISRQSFWMDEAGPAFKALLPTLKDWWAMTLRLGGSDVQMPVYMFLLWAWEKVAGPGEFILRAINLPWLVLAVLALRRVRWWPLVCLTSPFVLYYVGELRPYAMQIGASSLAAAGLIRAGNQAPDSKPLAGLHHIACGSLLLCLASLTSAVWAGGLWLGILIMRTDWLKRPAFWLQVSPWALLAVGTAGFYVFTLMEGYQAAGMESGSVLSVFFGFYEIIGLLGLGPGRDELRVSVKSVLPWLPVIIPAFALVFAAWFCGMKTWVKSTPKRTVLAIACMVILPVLLLTVVGLIKDFRVLGRHLSPAIPAVLLPIALALEGRSWGKAGRAIAVAGVCCGLASALSLRLSSRHERDDFRQASAIAIDHLTKGQSVWWQSDMNAMRYYAYLKGGMRLVMAVQHLEAAPPSLLMADVIILNRPELKYRSSDYKSQFRANDLERDPRDIKGFEIWKSKYP